MKKYTYFFPYFGSKLRLIERITLMLPKDCTTCIEICGGSGAFILNRYWWFKKAIYNEYNEKICNLFRLMKDPNKRDELIERLVNIQYDKEVFNAAKKHYNDDFKEIVDKLLWRYQLLIHSDKNLIKSGSIK